MVGFQFPLWVTATSTPQTSSIKTRLLSAVASDDPKYVPGAYLNTVRRSLATFQKLIATTSITVEPSAIVDYPSILLDTVDR